MGLLLKVSSAPSRHGPSNAVLGLIRAIGFGDFGFRVLGFGV